MSKPLPPNPNSKVVLAFSGGLDTTFCALWLAVEQGLDVYAITVNTGGFSDEDRRHLETHARALGVADFVWADATHEYYERVVQYLIYGNVLKNASYPLSVSAERVAQALAVAHYARSVDASFVAHGSTGAGNDQVRFDMILETLVPHIQIMTPIRDLKLSREAEIEYLRKHGVRMNFEKARYSINKGLWGTSVGGKETLTSHLPLPEEAWPTPVTATQPRTIRLTFEKGTLKAVDDQTFGHAVEAIQHLQQIASPYGIGRDIHTGDTIIGIKGRVGFEAAAPVLIIKAHHALEKHTLTKWQLYWKDQLAAWYGNWLHEGQYLDPVMRNLEAFLKDTQHQVTGSVQVTLHPYRFTIDGITSPHDLMSAKFGSYGEMNNAWTGDDVKGFTKIFGNQTNIYFKVNGVESEEGVGS